MPSFHSGNFLFASGFVVFLCYNYFEESHFVMCGHLSVAIHLVASICCENVFGRGD